MSGDRLQPWLLAALIGLAPTLAQARAARPDPLKDEAGCDHYRGVPIGANDPTQQFELIVCPTADGVRAKVQTSSLESGWSVRASVGHWDPAGRVLTLRDTEFLESRPEPGWRFCLIDALVLEKTDHGLTGNYVSEACDDRAELKLDKLEPAVATAEPRSDSANDAPPVQTPTSTPESRDRGCTCEATSSTPPAWALLLVLALALGAARRHTRRRSDGTRSS
ncbi:MAG TPA: MYXO-CTERM sorting domain-containing protein [Enhygromyxa sp.]|nr:MYXO-CTERM sorting domain-containing protein [Enhygromyxa sp.]